jgi:hypothetical protein
MAFPLEQAKATNYFHQGFVGSAVQVVGFGVLVAGAELPTGETVGCILLGSHHQQPMKM